MSGRRCREKGGGGWGGGGMTYDDEVHHQLADPKVLCLFGQAARDERTGETGNEAEQGRDDGLDPAGQEVAEDIDAKRVSRLPNTTVQK